MNFKFAFIVLGLVGCGQKASKPNIIYILADDLGYGDVSCYNEDSKIMTTNIDLLASEGVRFTDAHTSSSVCTPTRYGILTGRYNWRTRLKQGVLDGYSDALIERERATIASFLKVNGYTTGGIGKWHLGWQWSSIDQRNRNIDFSKPITDGPTTRGFDYFFGFSASLDMPPYVWVENDQPTSIPLHISKGDGNQAFWRAGLVSDDFDHVKVLSVITKKAKQFIKTHSDSGYPFFLYLPLSAPHTPILPTKEFQGKSELNNPYADFVLMVDWMVGEIMTQLKQEGIDEDTMVIFTSDNGCSPRANLDQLAMKGHNPSYRFRGTKADIFEGGHRVPFIVRYPHHVKTGVSNQLICTTDLFSTVADLLHITLPDDVAEDSYSFLSALGQPTNRPERENVIHHSVNGSFAFREGDFKTIFCPGSGGWSYPRPNNPDINTLPNIQVYNLANDYSETTNLVDQFPEMVEKHKMKLLKYITEGRSTEGASQYNDTPGLWEQVKMIQDRHKEN